MAGVLIKVHNQNVVFSFLRQNICLGYYKEQSQLGDTCIQIFHLGRYIVGYTVGNLVLRRRVSGAVKRDFRTYIRR